jgi:hypothetical protein
MKGTYLIYEPFLFTGNYSHILTGIFWLTALFVFMITAIGAHGSSCLYSYASDTVFSSDFFLYSFVLYLIICRDIKYPSRGHRKTYRNRRSVKNNHNREILTTVIVSWLWHYTVVPSRFLFCTLCDPHCFSLFLNCSYRIFLYGICIRILNM